MWSGIVSETSSREGGVVCFLGSRIDSPIVQEAASNSVYELANGDNFDGLVIVSSAISTYLDSDRIQELFDAYGEIPAVSIGVPVSGASNVTVDSYGAMVTMTEHLVTRHERRNFAIIAGPKWHVESEQRCEAIRNTLERYNIEWNPELLDHGTFERDSGIESMRKLLDSGQSIDAVLCLNDRMALGALEVLHQRGIGVPQEMALVGFDGIEETMYCTPPLTTVLQPLHELGARAVQELYRRLGAEGAAAPSGGAAPEADETAAAGAAARETDAMDAAARPAAPPEGATPAESDGPAPTDQVLYCEPIVRESCGCPVSLQPTTGTPRAGFLHNLPEEWQSHGQELFDLAVEQDTEAFLQRFNHVLTLSLLRDEPLQLWADFLASLRSAIIAAQHGTESDTPLIWSQMFDAANVMLGEMKSRKQAARRMEHIKHTELMRSVGISLTEAFETSELVERLRAGLLRIGFKEAFLALYEDEDRSSGSSRLLLAMSNGVAATEEAPRFPRSAILPESFVDLGESRTWVLTPLVFQDRPLGYLMLPGDSPDTGVYETLSKQLASSLKGALLLEQVRGHEQSLEEEVKRRTEELTVANRSLREEISTRTRLEQEVVEISKQTMERIGQDLHDDLCQHLAGIAMHVSALESTLDGENSSARDSAARINELIGESIERAKSIVRGLVPVGFRDEGLLVALNALVDAVKRSSGILIALETTAEVEELDDARALELYRIIQEALTNSVKHSGCSAIAVRLYTEESVSATGVRGHGERPDATLRHPDGSPHLSSTAGAARTLVAVVRDDGKGVAGDSALSSDEGPSGMGLKIMKYRAEKAEASLKIEPGDPGTVVRCTLRLERGEEG